VDRDPAEEQLTGAMTWHKLNRIDPVRRQAEADLQELHGLSPMDPPDAYAPPSIEPVPPSSLHPFLKRLREKHAPLIAELDGLERTLVAIREGGFTQESDAALRRFFAFFDREFHDLCRREEASLFPILHERLVESGEHGKGDDPATAVEVMKDEHAEALQLAALAVNFLGLAFRLPDERSRLIVLDAALEQIKNLVELLRLMVFRKSNVLYTLAHRLISGAEFDRMLAGGSRAG